MKFLFAWRYFKSKKSTAAINIIAWISVLAITVGTAALIIVLSVFNGFEGLVKGLYGDFYPALRISPTHSKFFALDDAAINRIQKINGVEAISGVVEEKAVVVNGDYQTIIYLRGVDAENAKTNNVSKHIIRGEYFLGDADKPSLVMGIGVESAIGADPTNLIPLVVYLPDRSAESFSADAMNSYNASVSGSFIIQQEFDNKYAFTNIGFLRYMLDLKNNQYSYLELNVPENLVSSVTKQLKTILKDDVKIQNKYQQNQSLYAVMQMEKWIVYAILSLILIVAAFNMIGALTMLVLEKQKDISVLKAMGATSKLIRNIFLYEGLLLAGIGAAAGILIALGVCLLQQHFHLIKLEGGSFIIDYYPVKIIGSDFILVSLTVLIVALLASWIPSSKAAKYPVNLRSQEG